MEEQKIRVVLAKPGLDGHDRGVKVVARGLVEAGMEVIYLGLRVPEEVVVEAALQEDADVIGISNLSGALVPIVARVLELLAAQDATHMGVRGIFGPGTDTGDIVRFIRQNVHG